ncbi:MAG: hypothetical protein ACOYYS_21230 [Chloroflexota bacterium]
MIAKKVIKALGAHAKNVCQFTCPAETDSAEDITLLFKADLASQKLEVVQLALDSLPKTHNGDTIEWIANFGIRERATGKYVDVPYTVFVKQRPGRALVYFDGKEVKRASCTKAVSLSADAFPMDIDKADRLAVTLSLGDPGIGWDGAV